MRNTDKPFVLCNDPAVQLMIYEKNEAEKIRNQSLLIKRNHQGAIIPIVRVAILWNLHYQWKNLHSLIQWTNHLQKISSILCFKNCLRACPSFRSILHQTYQQFQPLMILVFCQQQRNDINKFSSTSNWRRLWCWTIFSKYEAEASKKEKKETHNRKRTSFSW